MIHHSLKIGHLIVYGVKETVSNVDPSVYDTAFVIENGQMVMQTDLSLNGHRLHDSVHYINGILNTNNGNTFLLNGCDKIIIPNHSHILTIKVLYFKLKSQYTPISLKVKHSDHLTQSITYTSTKATRLQTISINLVLAFGHVGVELASVGLGGGTHAGAEKRNGFFFKKELFNQQHSQHYMELLKEISKCFFFLLVVWENWFQMFSHLVHIVF